MRWNPTGTSMLSREMYNGERRACVPCMRSCSGVNVPGPGVRGAEGHGKRQGVTVRWGRKAAGNAGAGRGTRTGSEGWYRRGARARHRTALPPQVGCAGSIRRLGPDGLTADHGRSARCPGPGLRVEPSALTAPQPSAAGIGSTHERAEGLHGRAEWRPEVERCDGLRRGVGSDLAPGMNSPLARRETTLRLGCRSTLLGSAEPPAT
jgi:hypothetical protein